MRTLAFARMQRLHTPAVAALGADGWTLVDLWQFGFIQCGSALLVLLSLIYCQTTYPKLLTSRLCDCQL